MKKGERADWSPGTKGIYQVLFLVPLITECVNATISSADDLPPLYVVDTIILIGSRQLVSAINTIVPVCIFARTELSLGPRGKLSRVSARPPDMKMCSLTSPRGLTTRFPTLFQIAPSAKKLWGVDEGGSKDEGGVKGGGILHLGDHQMWRDSTWSTSGTIADRAELLNVPYESDNVCTICRVLTVSRNYTGSYYFQ